MRLGESLARVGILIILVGSIAVGDEPALTLADLKAYRLALDTKLDRSAPPVKFRELWDHPEAHSGRSVKVQGRLARRFQQPGVGGFPPLIEAWVVSEAGDPFCLVFPQSPNEAIPEIGSPIQFTGIFLRQIQYQGGDVARLAPLVVGSEGPLSATDQAHSSSRSWASIDWLMGLVAAGFVGLILIRRHFSRPSSLPRPLEPSPVFIDGDTDQSAGQNGSWHEENR